MQGACYNYNIDIFKYSLSQISKINDPILLDLVKEWNEIINDGDTEYINQTYEDIYKKSIIIDLILFTLKNQIWNWMYKTYNLVNRKEV